MIQKLKHYSIKAKLMLIIMAASGTALLMACTAFITYDLFSLRQNLVRELDIAARFLGSACDAMISFGRADEATDALKTFSDQPEVVMAAIYSANGVFAFYPSNSHTAKIVPSGPGEAGHRFEGGFLHVTHDIMSGGEKIGAIYVRSNMSHAKAMPFRYLGIAGLVMIAASLSALWVSSILQKEISQPLNELLRVSESVGSKQDYSMRAAKETEDEVGKLVDGFNSMLSQVQARDTALQRAQEDLERKVDERTKDLQLEIIERQNTQEALERAKELAESASRAKSEFLAVMSHEIRTPMNGVIGMTSLLSETTLDADQREFVETIRLSGESLMVIINDILDFSKIEAGKMDLEEHPFELRSCIEECLDLFMPKATQRGIELVYSIAEDVPGRVIGDVTRIRQVTANLLGNAIKFTERGEIEVTVRNAPSSAIPPKGKRLLQIDIRDTGIGIPENKLGRLFLAFSQVDSSTSRRYGGTGLGLAISKRLCGLMGGTISVSSREGVGSTFSFTVGVTDTVQSAPSRVPNTGNTKDLKNRTLLFADDNPTNLRIVERYARLWGMRFVGMPGGQEAVRFLEGTTPVDAALLDVAMPETSGVEVAQRLRQLPHRRQVPILFLATGGGASELRNKAEKLDVASILQKPIKPSPLRAALDEVLGEDPSPNTSEAPALDGEQGISHHARPLSILLAEDNAINQLVAKQLLQRLGYRPDMVANGNEAIRVLGERNYDVVLMDVQMPEMNGCDATRIIRQSLPDPKQPWIIAMTANAMHEDREMCLASGMDDYLSKPVRLADLDAVLRKAWAVKSSRLSMA